MCPLPNSTAALIRRVLGYRAYSVREGGVSWLSAGSATASCMYFVLYCRYRTVQYILYYR
jgi:hypothetical protein